MQGFFITFEGIDGSGKSTMAALLHDYLRAAGHSVVMTREPGDSRLGGKLRQMLLLEADLLTEAREEALLFAADRAAHVRELILPALAAHKIVLCDRYTDSTLAYQGGGRGLDEGFLRRLNSFAGFDLSADMTFYFDLPLAAARQRQNRDKDRMEQQDGEFFARIIAVYQRLAAAEPARIRRIDATQEKQVVFAAMLSHLPEELRAEEHI